MRRPWHRWPAWSSTRATPGRTMEEPYARRPLHHLTYAAVLVGMIAALVGAGHLVAWFGGYLTQEGLITITMKTNAALCLTLVGAALMLLVPAEARRVRRWAARVCAALALVVGLLTLVENLSGWDFGIDQLLAGETPGAMATTGPNRMGMPASLSFTLIGLALLILSRRDRRGVRVVQALALAVCLIALLPTVGFLYGAEEFYGIARYTGIAWPTALALLLLGVGLLCARPAEGLMAQVTADDPGGISLRRLLPALVILPLLLGWLRLVGERAGVFDAATGTGIMMLVFIITFAALAYYAGRQTSHSAQVLRESEQRLSLAQQIAHVGTFDWDIRTGVNVWTPELEALYGLPPGGFAKSQPAWEQLVHPQDRAEAERLVEQAFETGAPTEGQWRVVWPDGSVHWLAGRWQVFKDESGKPLRMTGVNIDITEPKRAEEALRETRDYLDNLFNYANAPIIVWNPEFKITRFNPAFERLTGRQAKEVLGQEIGILFPPESREESLAHIRRTTAEKRRWEVIEIPILHRNGSMRTVLWNSANVLASDNKTVIATIAQGQDITERKQAEEALRELNANLEGKVAQRTAELRHRTTQLQKLTLELSQAEERERRRIALILHEDLQQQIAGARFHVNLLKGRARDDRQRADADRVDEMLKEVIEKSRSLSHDLSPAVLHMNDLAEVLQWLANRVRTQHGLIAHVDVLGETTLQSEALALFLFRAAQEMLFNVVRHARVREARIRVRRCGRYVCLSVSDQGRGFDPQELKETSGFGLLSLRERTELLGGRMKIESATGQGSRLRIVVPDAERLEDRGQKTEDRRKAEEGSPSSVLRPPSSGGILRVLLVDDHEIVRQGLVSLLQEMPGVVVVGEAADGREAINLAGDLHPDVVVMDVSMPLMSGDEATRQIKTYLPRTRVIALSMYDEADKQERMYQAGAEGYVLKTASADELLAAIRGMPPRPQEAAKE